MAGHHATETRAPLDRPARLGRVAAACVVLLAATWLRFDRLSSFPPGMYHDVAYNGADVLDILRGHLAIFFTANNGREPLFIYLQAASVELFGPTVFAMRVPSAVIGILTVAVVYAWARGWFGFRVGIVSAAVLATLLWHVYLSRIGLRVITLPLATTLTFYLMWRAVQRRDLGTSLLTGLSGGMAMYTHIASRLMPPLALLFVLAETLFDRGFARRNWRAIAVVALLWLAVAAPLYAYFLDHQDIFFGHAGEVSYLSAQWDEQRQPLVDARDRWLHVLASVRRVTGMFLAAGDRNPRHNVPGRPVFDPLVGALFVLGLAWSIARAGSRGGSRPDRPCHVYLWSLLWWLAMVFPTALSIDSPHYHRTAGGLPPTCLFVGLGADWLCAVAGRLVSLRWTRYLAPVAAGAIVLGVGTETYRAVWGDLAPSEQVRIAWETSLRDFADATGAAVAAQPGAPVYVQVGADSRFMLLETQFEASRALVWRFVPADQSMLPIPSPGTSGMIVVGDARLPMVSVAVDGLPGARVDHTSVGTDKGEFVIPTYRLVRLSAGQLDQALSARRAPLATFGDQVVLQSARIVPAAGGAASPDTAADAAVSLVWRFAPSARASYDLFVQLLDANGKLVAQDDRGAAASALGPDERGLTFHHLRVSGPAPPGPYRAIVGVAAPDGSSRLTPNGVGLPVVADAVVVGTIGGPAP